MAERIGKFTDHQSGVAVIYEIEALSVYGIEGFRVVRVHLDGTDRRYNVTGVLATYNEAHRIAKVLLAELTDLYGG